MRALSGFKADFGPLLGTSDSPARDALRNTKMFLEFDLLYRLKMSGVNQRGCMRPSLYFATHRVRGNIYMNIWKIKYFWIRKC